MTSSNAAPIVSIVLATHNRCAVVRNTLDRLAECGIDRSEYEIVVVDNASDDGTPAAVRSQTDVLLQLRRNAGSCSKMYGVDRSTGRFIVFLDDDSYPRPGSIARMIERFESDPQLGAAGFRVHLPDGRQEGSALPSVFVGCGVGFRAEALRGVGGLDRSFFMQAEEYDLSFRLVAAGWKVKVFDDLHVDHLKTDHARRSERTTYYDVRNNLRVIARYLPPEYERVYRADCVQRYAWLAEHDGHQDAYTRGARAGRWRGAWERMQYRRRRLAPAALEHFFQCESIARRMATLANGGVRRLVFAGLGKNVFPFHRGAQLAGIAVAAIGDDRFGAVAGRKYRGAAILPLAEALRRSHDAVVISDTAPVHAAVTRDRVLACASQPVHDWFGVPRAHPPVEIRSSAPPPSSDDIPAEAARVGV